MLPSSSRPPAKPVEVENRDPAPGGGDEAAGAQMAERFADGLAGRARPPRQLLLRQRQRDPHTVAGRLAEPVGHLDEPPCDAPGGVVRAELDALAVGVAALRRR